MRYRLRYNVGPLYADRPLGGHRSGGGLVAGTLNVLWRVVAFVLQLAVWAVLLLVGIVYTVVWLIVWPFHRLLAGRSVAARG